MIDPAQYITGGIKQIREFIANGDLQKAHRGCQELLRVDPYDGRILRLLQRVEEKIMEANIENVKREVRAVEHLWDEEKYGELLSVYNKLYAYAPKYGPLLDLIQKAEEKLAVQKQNQRGTFIKQALEAVQRVLKEKRYGEAIQACEELLEIDPANGAAGILLREAKNKLIEEKLATNERIVDSGNFEQALELYNALLAINPENKKVLSLAADAQKHLYEKRSLEQKIEINEGASRIKELFANQEYEKALKACNDILQIDSKNFTANLYRQKTQDILQEETDVAVLQKMKARLPALRSEYQSNKNAFIKI